MKQNITNPDGVHPSNNPWGPENKFESAGGLSFSSIDFYGAERS